MEGVTFMKLLLTIITIVELAVCHSLGGSALLWVGYIIYTSL